MSLSILIMTLAPLFPDGPVQTLSALLRTMHTPPNPPVKWRLLLGSNSIRPDLSETLVVGHMRREGSVYIGCDGWEVSVSSENPQQISTELNPISLNAAACFGVSEVFKRLLARHADLFSDVIVIPLSGSRVFSTLTYRSGTDQENPPFPEKVDFGRLTMVGLAAGGGATAYTLASVSSLHGNINLIELVEIIESNLNRYEFADDIDARNKRAKTDIIAHLFRSRPDISLNSFTKAFSEVVPCLQVEDFGDASASIHSREARREIQYESPRVLCGRCGGRGRRISHLEMYLFDQSECMFCKHPTGEQGMNPLNRVSEFIDLWGLCLHRVWRTS